MKIAESNMILKKTFILVVGQGAVEQKTLSKIQVFGTEDWKEVITLLLLHEDFLILRFLF